MIQTSFIHDFSKFAENCEIEGRAIEVLGSALEGEKRPMLVTNGMAMLAQGRPATEEDAAPPMSPSYPRASEAVAGTLQKRGMRASVGAPSPGSRYRHTLIHPSGEPPRLMGMFVSRDLTASSMQTQERLGWRPTGPGLIADLDGANYFEQTAHAAR